MEEANHDLTAPILGRSTKMGWKSSTFQSITPNVCHVLGISDDGGSTARGPSIGNLRSKLTRLIMTDGPGCFGMFSYQKVNTGFGIKYLLRRSKAIRGFLMAFNSEILNRAHKHFNFRNGSSWIPYTAFSIQSHSKHTTFGLCHSSHLLYKLWQTYIPVDVVPGCT
ncbi:hypothetical protein BC941DRAFT_465044 [Chlamydoabsidia padenii]|nr:hypothetical protein BC941DRAFT_465044 [Chlamydoabsidia padenii]